MDNTNNKNDGTTFTIISQDGMDLVNSFQQQSKDNGIDDDPFLLTTTDIDSLVKIDNKPKKWMKIESCINNCHLKMSEEDQKNTFDSYWNNSTVISRYKFINEMAEVYLPKDCVKGTPIIIGEQKYYVFFNINKGNGFKHVCRPCFRFMLGEQEPFIKTVLAQKLINFTDDDNDSFVNNFPENQNRTLCSMKCNLMVSDKEKKQNLYNYWHETTIEQRCKFILESTDIEENIRYKINIKSTSNKPYISKFHLETSFGRQLVCANCFRLIIKESASIINEILDEKWTELSSELENGEKYNQVISHFKKFPLFETHHVTDSGNEKYLPRGLTLETMYYLYKEEISNPMNFLTYQKIFQKTKLRFLSSVVEKCLHCEMASQQSQSTDLSKNKIRLETYLTSHLNGALKSHSFKLRDEKRKVNTLLICTFKFHPSLPTPFINNPIHYYTEPLWTYNFTITETSKTKPTEGSFKSYVWNETQGQKTVNEIASCLYNYLENLPRSIKTVVFYSTSCNGESRSKLLCKFLANIVINHPSLILLEHKFLLDGHFYSDKNQRENWCPDILAKNVGKIEEPNDWYSALNEIAIEKQSQIIVMDNSKFYNFKTLLGNSPNSSIDGGKIDDDVTCIQYTKTGNVFFKKKWTGSYEVMFTESQQTNVFNNFKNTEINLIMEKKKNNLLNLLPFLNSRVHDFYQNLQTVNSETNAENELNDFTSNKEDNLKFKIIDKEEENVNSKKNTNEKEEFNLNIVKVESNYDDSILAEENEDDFSLVLPAEESVVKEEIDIEQEKAPYDNKFSDDESDDEICSEFEQSDDNSQIIGSTLFPKTQDSEIKSFNEKFYENTNSQNIKSIMKNFELSGKKKRIDDNLLGLDHLKKMKQFQPLGQCSNLCYLKVTPKEQERVFSTYWHKGTSESRFNFIYDTIQVLPQLLKSKPFSEDPGQFSVKFLINTERGPQVVCKLCYNKILCDRPSDILTVLKLKAQTLIDEIKSEVHEVEALLERNNSKNEEEVNNDNDNISKWKTDEYDCSTSKLLRMEKLNKGYSKLQPCRNGCFVTIKNQDQEQIYNSYWRNSTIHSRYHFINASVKVNNSRNSNNEKSGRKRYYHNSSIGPQRVCKTCFAHVLGETMSFVESVLQKSGRATASIKKKIDNPSTSTNENQPVIFENKNIDTANKSVTNSQKDSSTSADKIINNENQEISKNLKNLEIRQESKKPIQKNKQIHKEQTVKIAKQIKTPKRNEKKQISENQDELSEKISHQLTTKRTLEKINADEMNNALNTFNDSATTSANLLTADIIKQIQLAQEHIHDYLITRMKKNHLQINIQAMYSQYQKKVTVPLSIGWYQNILSVNNVNYKPAFIDKCDECETYSDKFKNMKNLQMRERICERLTSHLDYSTIVYKCKFQEEESARLINTMMVCSFGFQQNFPIPSRTNSNSLSIFNLTIWQFKNNHMPNNPMFYVWTQVEGKRTSNEIASCLFQYLKQLPAQLRSLIIYSSSCHGESKNKTLAQMLSYFMTNHKSLVSVDHKFTYSGHAQLKDYLHDDWIGDVVQNHSIKADEPEDWYRNFQAIARQNKKSNIVFMEPEMFVDFESLWKDQSSTDEVYISPDVRWLKYTKNGNVFFKKSLLERHNFELLPMQGQQQFQDLLNMQLFNLLDASPEETNVQLETSIPQLEQCIIKTEIDFDDENYTTPNEEDYLEPSKKRRKTENESISSEGTSRSKRIRKKREILSL